MKKGFTLIEVLAVIVILGILAAITVPIVQRNIDSSKDKLYNFAVDQIKDAAKQYVANEPSEISGFEDNNVGYITIGNLYNEGLLDDTLKNPKTENDFNASGVIKVVKPILGDYQYYFYPDGMPHANIEFVKTFGGSKDDTFNHVIATSDDYYVAVGNSCSKDIDMSELNKGDCSATIVKYDMSGNQVWKNIFSTYTNDGFNNVKEVKNGYIAVGYSGFSSAIIVKYDLNGNLVWNKDVSFQENTSSFNDVVKVTDGYVAVGTKYKNDTNDYDAVIVKFDLNGNFVWDNDFVGNNDDLFYKVISTADGYIAAGQSDSTDGDMAGLAKGHDDLILVKYGNNGAIVWKKSVGGSQYDNFGGFIATDDGGYLITGSTNSTDGDMSILTLKGQKDGFIFKYDSNNNLSWGKNFGGSLDDTFGDATKGDDGYTVISTSSSTDGDFISLGTGNFIIKYSINGNVLWTRGYGGSGGDNFKAVSTANNQFTIVGSTYSNDGDFANLNKGGLDAFILGITNP